VAEADAVVHLAASAGVRRRAVGGTDPWEQDNVVATRRLLAVVPFSTPLVVASSSSVYGGAALTPGGVRPSVESDPLRPLGGYARSKVVVEALCAARRREGAPVAVVRPFTVVGEGQRPDMALHRWIEAARAGRPLRVLGSGRRGRDLTRVEDVVEGLLRVLQRGFVGTVNLGSGSLVTLDEMVETVREEVARVPVVVEPAHPAEAVFTLADTRRCQRQLGFRPATDLAAVVRAMVGERDRRDRWLREAPAELYRRGA
jgi:nucleoside-diphosphate-sugar epimerase